MYFSPNFILTVIIFMKCCLLLMLLLRPLNAPMIFHGQQDLSIDIDQRFKLECKVHPIKPERKSLHRFMHPFINFTEIKNVFMKEADQCIIKDLQTGKIEPISAGSTLADGFECMGACGPGCPRFGSVKTYTANCMAHDLCIFIYGFDRRNSKSWHRQCGGLFKQAMPDWWQYGHVHQKRAKLLDLSHTY